MAETLPLFPLGTVLFPGVVLPLHIFEERYRQLVRDMLDAPPDRPRRFGVVAIRQGHEVGATGSGADATPELYPVGCTAQLRRVQKHDDGRFDIVTVGAERFDLHEVLDDGDTPYLTGRVEWRPTETGPAERAAVLSASVLQRFREYVDHVAALRGGQADLGELPNDPATVSWLVASAALLTMDDRQALLETDTDVRRLQAESRLLRRESAIVQELRAVPVPFDELVVDLSKN